MSVQEDIKRFSKARDRKTHFANLYEDALTFAAPQRDSFNEYSEGQPKTNPDIVFDSTAMSALGKFASNLQSSLVPPMKKWISFKPGHMVPENEKKAAQAGLDNLRDIIFSYLHASNFDVQISESFLDLGVGTGALLVQKGTKQKPFRFVSVPLSQLYLEESSDGRIGAVFRKHSVPIRSIKEVWPDAKLSESMKEALSSTPDSKIELIEMTIPDDVIVKKDTGTGSGKKVKTKVKGFRYTLVSEKDSHELLNKPMEYSPWVVFRWSVMPGEVYGRGPLLQSLPDIKTLNKAKELTLKNAAMAIAGAWTVRDDGVININTMSIYPGCKIPVESNGGSFGPSIDRLPENGNFNVSDLIIKDLQRAINDMLFAEPLGPIDLPVKSATEMSLRQQELSKRTGSSFGRLNFEMVGPLTNILIYILGDLGIIELNDYSDDDGVITVQHISPLAMAQDEEELMALMRWAEWLKNTFGEQMAMMMMKPDKLASRASKLMNIPSDVVPSDEEFAQLKNNITQLLAGQAAGGQQ